MNANDFQKYTINTAIYPGAGTGDNRELVYLGLGLTSEAGEVAGKIKKLVRDGQFEPIQIAYELGYDPTSTLTNEQINAVYNRKRVRELERGLETKKEKEQYSKVLPWLRNDEERIQFLTIPNLEGRQSWINNRGIWDRAQGMSRETKDLVDNQDIAVGMPMDLVRRSWGEPTSVEVSGNPIYKNERWRYMRYSSQADGFRQEKRIVYFEAGKVVGWETE